MRTFIGGDGSDTSEAVDDYFDSTDQPNLADLYLIGEFEDSDALWMTNWDTPLLWSYYGKYLPANVSRGTIESKLGLEVANLDFEWQPDIGIFTSNIATASPYQKAQIGFYDNKKFRLWRCVMPTKGDANTLGACEFYGGWIEDVEIARGKIKFNIQSFVNVTNEKVPMNTIESTSALPAFTGATPVTADGETQVPRFQAVAPSNATIIIAQCLSPTANKVYGDQKFQHGYMVFESGSSLAGRWAPIASSGSYKTGGVTYNLLQIYGLLPWPPAPGDTFYISTQKPQIAAEDAFIYVPAPETAL